MQLESCCLGALCACLVQAALLACKTRLLVASDAILGYFRTATHIHSIALQRLGASVFMPLAIEIGAVRNAARGAPGSRLGFVARAFGAASGNSGVRLSRAATRPRGDVWRHDSEAHGCSTTSGGPQLHKQQANCQSPGHHSEQGDFLSSSTNLSAASVLIAIDTSARANCTSR